MVHLTSLFAALAAFSVMGASAGPCKASSSTVTDTTSTLVGPLGPTTTAAPTTTTEQTTTATTESTASTTTSAAELNPCGTEGRSRKTASDWVFRSNGPAFDAHSCRAECLQRNNCLTFGFFDTQCAFYDAQFEDVVTPQPGTQTYFYDRNCEL
ncbi:hypothetical protein FALBO_7744 [Fusarium albosuccineum]|uniref:Apple domain-containing protein n=1 Tax=Fusarium albosuccineum TaxID=1237068 RepID=A0A8H4LCE8_9HYPO|nr:hypothetical protein FALBO_7744 [Fusarium albosuccineum]